MESFKNCPFCGSDVNIDFHQYGFKESQYQDWVKLTVKCDNCNAQCGEVDVPVDYDNGIRKKIPNGYYIEARNNWNKRPQYNGN